MSLEKTGKNSSESTIQARVLLRLVQIPGVRLWRCNTGKAVGYAMVAAAQRQLWRGNARAALEILQATRPVAYGVEGQCDLAGIIGPEGWRLEVEVKTDKGRLSEAQKRYRDMIVDRGGVYLLAREPEQAAEELEAIINAKRRV